jgi:hypothetical protein
MIRISGCDFCLLFILILGWFSIASNYLKFLGSPCMREWADDLEF